MREKVRVQLFAATGRRAMVEMVFGDDWSHGRRKWVRLERIINRPSDSYDETIIDQESGEVIHRCTERLSEHIGHGSAKPSVL